MPTIVKGRVAEDSNGYDGDNQSHLILLKKLCHARPKHRPGVGTKEARHSCAHVCELIGEYAEQAIDTPCVVGLPKFRLGDVYLVDVLHTDTHFSLCD